MNIMEAEKRLGKLLLSDLSRAIDLLSRKMSIAKDDHEYTRYAEAHDSYRHEYESRFTAGKFFENWKN